MGHPALRSPGGPRLPRLAGRLPRRVGEGHGPPANPAPPQPPGQCEHRPLQGLCERRGCGLPFGCRPLQPSVGADSISARGAPRRRKPGRYGIGPYRGCGVAGVVGSCGGGRHRKAGVHARRTQRFKTVAFAQPQARRQPRARKNEFSNTKKRPRHVAGPWFDTQGIHARKGCGRDGAGPPGGLRAGPDSGQL